jgi:hypothetical protein
MRDLFFAETINGNFTGRQDLIRGDGTAASVSNTQLAGVTLSTGTTSYPVDVGGNANARFVLNATTITGTAPTISIRPALRDGITADTTVAAVAPVIALNTPVAASLTLSGQRIALVTITVPAASTVVFNTAEYSAK